LQLWQRNHFEPADKIKRSIGHQTALCAGDRDGDIGADTIVVGCAGIAVESAREIDCDDVPAVLA
jgi:hypothetical protein